MNEDYTKQLEDILSASELPKERKQEVLIAAIGALAPAASQVAEQSAGGQFLQILMQLLVQFLPILLKLLAGGV